MAERRSAVKQNSHTRRYGEEAKEALASILLFNVGDARLRDVVVTAVEVSVDKTFMKAYVTCEPAHYEQVLTALNKAKGYIRSELGAALKWRQVPQIVFELDMTQDRADRIAQALTHIPPTMQQTSSVTAENLSEEEEGDIERR